MFYYLFNVWKNKSVFDDEITYWQHICYWLLMVLFKRRTFEYAELIRLRNRVIFLEKENKGYSHKLDCLYRDYADGRLNNGTV